MAIVANAIEILPKIWTAWVGRTNVADDRQTDGRATANSESAKKTCLKLLFALCYRLPWNNGFQTVAILPTTAYIYRNYTLHVKHISLWLPLIKAADSTRPPQRWHIDHKKWLMSRNGFRCIMRRRDETRVKKSVGRPSLTECFIVAGDTLRDWPLTARHMLRRMRFGTLSESHGCRQLHVVQWWGCTTANLQCTKWSILSIIIVDCDKLVY